MTLPSRLFIGVGAARSGTTRLWTWLNAHPDVHMSRVKETNFFANDLIGQNGIGDRDFITDFKMSMNSGHRHIGAAMVRDLQTYEILLSSTRTNVCGEISPAYLFHANKVASRIHAIAPHGRIIILLREPAARAVSMHSMMTSWGREIMPLEEALAREQWRMAEDWEYAWAYVKAGYYFTQVKSYLDVFRRDQIWVGLYDDLNHAPQDTFDQICHFLGIKKITINDSRRINQSSNSIGPLLRASRSRVGSHLGKLLPTQMRRLLRDLDEKSIALIKNRYKQSDFYIRLRMQFTEDVQSLDQLLPELNIAQRWGYSRRVNRA